MRIDFEKYLDNVYRFALNLSRDPHLAEDLTQECFLRAHQRINQLKNARGVKPWLFQILVNLWKDNLKKKRPQYLNNEMLDPTDKATSPEVNQLEKEAYDQLINLMQTLPEQQRSVLFLKAVEQFSNSDIAKLLGKSENSVKANLSIARKTLRGKLLQLSKEKTKAK